MTDHTPATIPHRTEDQLKEFILHYCDGKILCGFQVDPDTLGMVFMPLMLGGLRPPDEDYPVAPVEPVHPDEPVRPEQPADIPRPAATNQHGELLSQIRDLEFKVSWDDAEQGELESLRVKLDADLEAGRVEYEQEMARWEAAVLAQDTEFQELVDVFDAEELAYEEAIGVFDAAMVVYDAEVVVHLQACKDLHETFIADVGIIYEYYHKAPTNQGINGFPIFWSLQVMHKDDWEKVKPHITAELKRREEFTL
jgi:hypothetical protein